MKATKTVPQQQQQPEERLTFSRRLDSAGEIDGKLEPWMGIDLALLIDFIKRPTIDNTHTAVSVAFSRIKAITSGLSVHPDRDLSADDWEYVASTLLLNAEIMRRGFELLYEAT